MQSGYGMGEQAAGRTLLPRTLPAAVPLAAARCREQRALSHLIDAQCRRLGDQ